MEPPSPHDERVQGAWAAHRPYLLAVAAGMLKRRDDAEDVVQEAFARLAASPDAIEDVRGWLVVVTRRLCLDRLDLAENRRTAAFAEPPEAPGGIPDPADRVMLHDEVGQALWVVIDRLSPAERTSFILHDIFGFPFDAVAGLVGRTPAACRQLAHRARLSVGTGSSQAGLAEAWSGSTTAVGLAQRFIAVCEGGDRLGPDARRSWHRGRRQAGHALVRSLGWRFPAALRPGGAGSGGGTPGRGGRGGDPPG